MSGGLRVLSELVEGVRLQLQVRVPLLGLLELHAALEVVHDLGQHVPELGGTVEKLSGLRLGALSPVLLLLEDGEEDVREDGPERLEHAALDLSARHVLLDGLLRHPLGVVADEVHCLVVQAVHVSSGEEEALLPRRGLPRAVVLRRLVEPYQLWGAVWLKEAVDLGLIPQQRDLDILDVLAVRLRELVHDERVSRVKPYVAHCCVLLFCVLVYEKPSR